MAKIMSFTDEFGDTYSESYWRPVVINLSKEDSAANIKFAGFPSKEHAHRAGQRRWIGVKTYYVGGADYAAYFAPAILAASDPIEQAYKLACDTKDGLQPPPGFPDDRVSFFASATDDK